MKILCLLKFAPDADQVRYDREKRALIRENVHLILNPEDVTALATALELKRERPDLSIEAVSMAPRSAAPHLADLVYRGIDRATLLTDPLFAGSDTWATGRVLERYLGRRDFDCIFCGTQSCDGRTGQTPGQLAEALGIPLMVGISALVDLDPQARQAVVDADGETATMRFAIALPALLGFQYNPERKLPYIRLNDLNRDISSQVSVLGNDVLEMDEAELGRKGSLTQVRSLKVDERAAKEPALLRVDPDGVEKVYHWLAQKGFIRP